MAKKKHNLKVTPLTLFGNIMKGVVFLPMMFIYFSAIILGIWFITTIV